MTRTKFKLTFISLFLLALAAYASGRMNAQSAQSVGDEFFEKKIRPVLAANCYACHSSKLKSPLGGLVLDTRSGLRKGGDSGAVIVPGKPAESLLLRAMRYNDPRLKMPPTSKLSDAVIADFDQWIAAGAPDPRIETVPVAAKPRGIDFDKGRQWWAFQPVREQTVPDLKQTDWPRTKVDRFILAKLEQNKLRPSAEADPRTLILRATLDLTGLKPSYEEVESFANDKDPRAYEKLIDRLLASPRHGERWGRYWLDVARYAENGDTGGNRQAYPYAWRYRDWVIESINNDLPYDRFIKQQLAADLMPGISRNDLRALGYLGMAPSEWKEKKLSKELIDNLLLEEWDERVDAVGRGMLGLSVACARCHDHKFDPISQKDYYALAGVFASTSPAIRPLREIDPATETKYLAARHRVTELNGLLGFLTEEKTLDQSIAKPKAEDCRAEIAKLKDEMKALQEQYPELAESVIRIGAAKAEANANAGKPKPDPKVAAAAAAKRAEEEAKAPFINAVHDAAMDSDGSYADYTPLTIKPGVARDLPVFARGSSAAPGEIVPRHFLTVLSKNTPGVFNRGSGRLELAEKILTDAAPLSARVIVNRVWGWHFGKHLVTTPSDFGDRGERPTHPELLDDLAARFIAGGWSLKWLHREIMLSATYRQASKPRANAAAIDEENKWMWRMQPRRMDAEAIRDSFLQAAGRLNLEMYGPSLNLDNLDNTQRTVYGRVNRGGSSDILRLYDFPNPFQHSPTRNLTITPLQELFVLNSPFIKQLSSALAKSVEAEADAATRVRNLYRKILSRDPSAAEIKVALSYLNSATIEQFAQVLLATNEEVFWP